jgi:hypothetical protein
MFWNTVTGSVIGIEVAGLAYLITKQHHLAVPPTAPPSDGDLTP